MLPYVRMSELFGLSEAAEHDLRQVVVVETPNGRVGLVVEKVIGNCQTVIKNLSRVYRNVPGVSGATILGDGSVALIVDVPKVAALATSEESEMVS